MDHEIDMALYGLKADLGVRDGETCYLGTEEAIDALIKRFTGCGGGLVYLERAAPTPRELFSESVHDKFSERLHPETMTRREKMRANFGAADHVEWRLRNWGISHDIGDNRLVKGRECINLCLSLEYHGVKTSETEGLNELDIPPHEMHIAKFSGSAAIEDLYAPYILNHYLENCGEPRLKGFVRHHIAKDGSFGAIGRNGKFIDFYDACDYIPPHIGISEPSINPIHLKVLNESLRYWIRLVSHDVRSRHEPTLEHLDKITRDAVNVYIHCSPHLGYPATVKERLQADFSENFFRAGKIGKYFSSLDIDRPPDSTNGYHALYALHRALSLLPRALESDAYSGSHPYPWSNEVKDLLSELCSLR